ncbi:hypothetical protein KP509_09G018400 [Ceratopteris richardii]|uniref:Pentatricopeptide repeat-containing protein n=1 Tax=Ceratopteris richardii TaxID=49495 RepID=A0A8T2TZB8_CERRI|nr:hypothetical protein KP509_09G018400 [Ceratopteris richardii]
MRAGRQLKTVLQISSEASCVNDGPGFTTKVPSSLQEFQKLEELVINLCKQNQPGEPLALPALTVHCIVINNGLDCISVLLDHLIRLFALCGDLSASYQVFLANPSPSTHTWNAILSSYTQAKEHSRCLVLFDIMEKNNEVTPNINSFLCVLQACTKLRDIELGRSLHGKILSFGFELDICIGTSLINMYSECGYLRDMQQVFDVLPSHDIVSWGAIVSAYGHCGQDKRVIELFKSLQKQGIQPDRGLYVAFLKSCSALNDLEHGRWVHERIKASSLHSDVCLQSVLIEMYSVCGKVHEAYDIFKKMSYRDLMACGAMMSAYISNAHYFSVLTLYEQMQQEGMQPDSVILVCVIKACNVLGELALGRLIHEEAIRQCVDQYLSIGNTLVDLYAKCRSLEEAKNLFDRLPSYDLVSINVILAAYVDNGFAGCALSIFSNMELQGLSPDGVSFKSMLKACAILSNLTMGKFIHGQIIQCKLDSEATLAHDIVHMYARCYALDDALKVFHTLPIKDLMTWSSLMSAFAQQDDYIHILYLLVDMFQANVALDEVVFVDSLKACACLRAIKEGWMLNDKIIRNGFDSSIAVGNSLVSMYAKFGSMQESYHLFERLPIKNVASWGAIIGGYVQHGQSYTAFICFQKMLEDNIAPDQATLACAAKACGRINCMRKGKLLHHLILCSKWASDSVVGNAVIDMYVKCGSLRQAHQVFDSMRCRDTVSWTTMITGYGQYGDFSVMLEFYRKFQQEGLQPTRVLYLCMLQACVSTGAISFGIFVHEEAKKNGFMPDMAISNSLVELHTKWGDLDGAEKVLESVTLRDSMMWNILMAGYGASGDYRRVMSCLQSMQKDGLELDDIVFTVLLRACSNAGLLEESFVFFKSMLIDQQIHPDIEHYGCFIDILSRTGRVEEALELVHTLPNPPDTVIHQSLLASSRTYCNTNSRVLSDTRLQEVEQSHACLVNDLNDSFYMVDDYDYASSINDELLIDKDMSGITVVSEDKESDNVTCCEATTVIDHHSFHTIGTTDYLVNQAVDSLSSNGKHNYSKNMEMKPRRHTMLNEFKSLSDKGFSLIHYKYNNCILISMKRNRCNRFPKTKGLTLSNTSVPHFDVICQDTQGLSNEFNVL